MARKAYRQRSTGRCNNFPKGRSCKINLRGVIALSKRAEQIKQLKKAIRQLQNDTPAGAKPGGFLPEMTRRLEQLAETQQKELSRVSRALKKADRELNAVKERASVTVHDLKVPVTICLLNLELAEMEGEEAERENYLVAVRRELEFLLDTIGNLLELHRSETGTAGFKFQAITLGPLVDGVIGRMQVIIRDKPALDLRNELPHDLPAIRADRHKLTRVYNNLFSNAIKYTESGTITAGGEIAPGAGFVTLFLRDTGQGIEADRLPRLFEFFQGDDTKLESSGVGLALVRQVIQAHGGRVWIESEKGVGTTIFMEIPTAV